jgi:hypothetical protein
MAAHLLDVISYNLHLQLNCNNFTFSNQSKKAKAKAKADLSFIILLALPKNMLNQEVEIEKRLKNLVILKL